MIVELIEVRKIRTFEPMRRFLEDIPLPRRLSDLYATLLSRYAANDPENQDLSSTALKLLAATPQTLEHTGARLGCCIGYGSSCNHRRRPFEGGGPSKSHDPHSSIRFSG